MSPFAPPSVDPNWIHGDTLHFGLQGAQNAMNGMVSWASDGLTWGILAMFAITAVTLGTAAAVAAYHSITGQSG